MVPTALSRLVPELVVASTEQVLTSVLQKMSEYDLVSHRWLISVMVPTALSRLVPELVVASTDQVLTPVLHKKCLIMKNLGLNFPHKTTV